MLGRLGAGGGGLVLHAVDHFLASEIAIKLASHGSAADLLKEFEAFRQIRHANLVRVHDWMSLPDGQSFYTMDFMAGGDWGRAMGRPQSSEFVRSTLTRLLRGLGHLHCHGQMHGDLKPGNVLFGLSGEVKLSDVGMGNPGETIGSGTPGYAAPEVWEGARGDYRSDIYSASVMAYEALTGHHPFEGRTIREVVASQIEGWVPSPEAHGVKVDPDLARTVMRGLERGPQLRQASADEYLESLGVEDRVGEILGGRFVNRSAQLSDLKGMLGSEVPGSPTLVYLVGQPGSGRKALTSEFAHQAVLGGSDVMRTMPDATSGVGAPSLHAAETLLEGALRAKQLFLPDVDADTDVSGLDKVRMLARYLHSLSIERMRPSGTLIVCRRESSPPQLEHFEREIQVGSLRDEDLRTCIEGYLGRTNLETEVLEWLRAASGAVPGHLVSLLSSLVERGLLRRRAGTWHFVEGEQLRSLEKSLESGPWEASWRRLNATQRRILALLAQFSEGLPSKAVDVAFPDMALVLPELATRGWVRSVDARWQLGSLEARRTADAHADRNHLSKDRAILEADGPEHLSREEHALLVVSLTASGPAFDEGLWAAEQAIGRGDHAVAAELGTRCLSIAEALNDDCRAEDALLLLASARHQGGDWGGALKCLSDTRITRHPARREYLRGVVEKATGETDKSRSSLNAAVELAEQEGDIATLLVGQSELAELDWRHGDERARRGAIERVRAVLQRQFADGEFKEERAGLSYQLGAALIVAGKREDAKEVLRAGLDLGPGEYWSMRLSNALGTAEYYLGHFDEALSLMREAWQRAERGGFDTFKARIMSNRAGITYAIGGFRQAVEYHDTASLWARRTGSRFEFIAACQGAAVNQMLLAEYEGAITHVREASIVAKEIKGEYHIAKSIDLEALVEFYVGNWGRSRQLTDEAARENDRIGQSDITPRIDLMRGRLARVEGNDETAAGFLQSAERVLRETRDWEDLPGVQIELELLRAGKDPEAAVDAVLRIGRESSALTIQFAAAVALGEIVVDRIVDDRECGDYLASVLGKADGAGAMETVWRVNFALGEIAARRGDRKGAATRFAQSLRGFRQVADQLSAERRVFYLKTAHARHLLARVS